MNLTINKSSAIPTLDRIIDRNPVLVKSDTPVIDAIALMSPGKSKKLSLKTRRSSYVLAIAGGRIAGIFTESDLVQLIASGINLVDKKISEVMTAKIVTLKQSRERSISSAIAIAVMRENKIRHLPIVDSCDRLIGIITHKNISSIMSPGSSVKIRRVSDVMNRKVITSSGDASLFDIARLMSDRQVSDVIIVTKKTLNKQEPPLIIPIGIVSETDLVRFRALEFDFAQTKVETVMNKSLFPVYPCDSLWQVHLLMRSQKSRRLVVIEKSGELTGIVTQSSILEAFNPLEMSRIITILEQQKLRTSSELQEQNSGTQIEDLGNFEAIANSIAQDFDKIIVPILESARILALKFPYIDRSTQQLLKKIVTNSELGIGLVEEIFSYSSQLDSGLISLRIDRILSKVVGEARVNFPQSIKIFLDLPSNKTIPNILGNTAQLEAALMHLCLNSRNAMPDGGILRICLDLELVADSADSLAKVPSKLYLVVTVWDRGKGMSLDLKKHIFDIFSNPKKYDIPHKSGLVKVIEAVKNHRGFIKIDSEIGKGTLFKIYLPALS